jgi:hypothetical protein
VIAVFRQPPGAFAPGHGLAPLITIDGQSHAAPDVGHQRVHGANVTRFERQTWRGYVADAPRD